MAEYLWDYPIARATFAEAGEMLGWDIGELCRHGSMEELTRTDRTQLAVLTCSVAAWRVLEEEGASFSVAAGHSLGEYSALVATGHLDFADALRVVEQRGRAMQACAERAGRDDGRHHRPGERGGRRGMRLPVRRVAGQLQFARPAGHLRLGGVGRALPANWRRRGAPSGCCRCRSRGPSTPPFMAGAAESLSGR